ncbi:TPA: ubiquinol oxidase subunit II [Candidatus Saccharibacteria bacterium]|nr:ubiquinol oxidase subunit II [Candidatus Saccharibacteria bacterium]HRK40870.1 ubiquinol oxidase subunit II [Candidatus Saccharibacteria bacterium]
MLKRVLWVVVPIIALLGVIGLMVFAAQGGTMQMIDTKGTIGDQQRDTLFLAVAIMLIIIVPVFFLAFFIPLRYREGNKKATYRPDWESSKLLEFIWWGVPIIIVGVLSVIVWQTSHSLDPYKPLTSDRQQLKVQVVALQWRWLFLYPDYQVASIDELVIPINQPVEFTITSDAPMNSFWIPQLGGQIYAMSGMSTKLHLNARESGDYRGTSANLSGEGHADMNFTAKARSIDEFNAWVTSAKDSEQLTAELYEKLREPTRDPATSTYSLYDTTLYDSVINRYMGSEHGGGHH